mmetsp:Transcript_9969/g.24915  ORF Transcript_9969/g.24915 Transcript_9969/m.24915 type:complete len:350 (+) Transcript_9969:543-1592(+)
MTACVNECCVPVPPTSGVRDVRSCAAYTLRIADSRRSLKLCMPMYRSIMEVDSSVAVGLLTCLPARSLATWRAPCSNSATPLPTLPPGVTPYPPHSPATMLPTRLPYRLGVTMTSNWLGRPTSCMHVLSTIISSYLMVGNLGATARTALRNMPSPSFMMLALCTAVTFFLLLSSAYSNAYCAMRSDESYVMTLRLSTTPSTTSCSRPEYSPSVFSRITTMSRLSWRVLRPGMDTPCTRLTYRSRSLRSCTLSDCVSVLRRSSGVNSVPLSATPFLRMEASTSLGTSLRGRPSGSEPDRESKRSHLMGAPSASTTSTTDLVISGPMPSPGISVTVLSAPAPGLGIDVNKD